MIVSVPNIAHFSVSIPLSWGAASLIRMPAFSTARVVNSLRRLGNQELLNDASLVVTSALTSGLQGPKARFLNFASLGLLQHHLTKQYIMLGTLSDGKAVQKKVHWTIA